MHPGFGVCDFGLYIHSVLQQPDTVWVSTINGKAWASEVEYRRGPTGRVL